MWIDHLSSVFAVLALVALVAVVALGSVALVRWRQSDGAAIDIFERIQPVALWLAWLVASAMTFGSLYFALGAEYFHFPRKYFPNTLGWYQCICVVPLSVVLLIAAICKDVKIWQYTIVPVVVGGVFAAYNSQLQALTSPPANGKYSDPAAQRIVWKFGFVSLPLMALIGFVLLGLLLFTAQTAAEDEDERDHDEQEERDEVVVDAL